MPGTTIEERVAKIEADLVQVKKQLNSAQSSNDGAWWNKIVGVYKDDSEFAEAMRLGREYRESLRPSDSKRAD